MAFWIFKFFFVDSSVWNIIIINNDNNNTLGQNCCCSQTFFLNRVFFSSFLIVVFVFFFKEFSSKNSFVCQSWKSSLKFLFFYFPIWENTTLIIIENIYNWNWNSDAWARFLNHTKCCIPYLFVYVVFFCCHSFHIMVIVLLTFICFSFSFIIYPTNIKF